MKYKQGHYKIKNPEKYMGSKTSKDSSTAIYRSSWEKVAFIYLDNSPNIKRWASELFVIPYQCRLDNPPKNRRYYIDVYFEDAFGKHLVEIKPKFKTDINRIKKLKNSERYVLEYIQNLDKWKYAQAYSKANDMKFKIWTEDHIDELKRRISSYSNFY